MLSLLIALVSLTASAIPARPGLVRTLKLADGTSITARLIGDEHGHYWLGNDGKAYSQTTSEDVYEIVDVEAIRAKASVRRRQVNTHRIKRLAPRKVGDVGSITGEKKGLIILVNFSNVSFKSANNNALYQRIANEENFSYGNFKGSMYDYFYAQSDGQFQLTFDVVGPVTVYQKQSYYGGNDYQGYDKHPAEMVIEALKLVDNSVNFADYDWDGDKEVEQVYVVYAGQGEANGGSTNTIWPHEYQLSAAKQDGDGSGAQTLDGVKIDTYACGSELNDVSSIDGIGTMCHEFSHCLGYPDFYDTDYSGGQGMGDWDLMCSGSYNGDGYRPAGYTCYERWVAGWREPIELKSSTQVNNMPALVDKGAQSYIIYNPGNHNEYFLLENRQQKGWDTDIPGSGLLILHVDYSSQAWAENTPNDDPSHQRMTWIPADNKYQYETYNGAKYYTTEGEANDPYPYGSNNSFSATSTPAAKLYNKNTDGSYYLDSSVENITQNTNGTVSFKFKAADGSDPDDPDDPDDPNDPTGSDKYELVTDAGTLAAGDKVLIAYVDDQVAKAMGTQNQNNRAASDVTKNSDGTLTPGAEAQVITLEKEGGNYLFNVGNGYLYAANSSKNYLRTETTADANAKATIMITDGKATITFQGSNTHNVIRYNPNKSNGSPLFSCYSNSSTTGSLPQIYRQKAVIVTLVGDVNDDGYITIADVTALVYIILGKDNAEPHLFNHALADVNKDGSVTITDVTALVNIILGK